MVRRGARNLTKPLPHCTVTIQDCTVTIQDCTGLYDVPSKVSNLVPELSEKVPFAGLRFNLQVFQDFLLAGDSGLLHNSKPLVHVVSCFYFGVLKKISNTAISIYLYISNVISLYIKVISLYIKDISLYIKVISLYIKLYGKIYRSRIT